MFVLQPPSDKIRMAMIRQALIMPKISDNAYSCFGQKFGFTSGFLPVIFDISFLIDILYFMHLTSLATLLTYTLV